MNKFGLSRSIPDAVKNQVRKRCGFGCVICGAFIIEYDHFDPEYADAKRHDPDGITLLCGSCHDKKSRRFISQQIVKAANANPRACRDGVAREFIPIHDLETITLGPLRLARSPHMILYVDMSLTDYQLAQRRQQLIVYHQILGVHPSESGLTPFDLDAAFFSDGIWIAKIVRNHFETSVGVRDFVAKASNNSGRIKIELEGFTEPFLDMSFDQQKGFHIDRLHMKAPFCQITATPDLVEIVTQSGARSSFGHCFVGNILLGHDFQMLGT